MRLNLYTVYDEKAQAYLPPLCYMSKGLALRAFAEAANDPQSNIGKYPADFTMFEIGIFDESAGVIATHESKKNLGTALEIKGLK